MGHAVIQFKDRHKLMNEASIERAMHLMYETYLKKVANYGQFHGLRDLFQYWGRMKSNLPVGCCDIEFDRYIEPMENDDVRIAMLALIDETIEGVRNAGPTVSGDRLNRIAEIDPGIYYDVPTEKVVDELKHLRKLMA